MTSQEQSGSLKATFIRLSLMTRNEPLGTVAEHDWFLD